MSTIVKPLPHDRGVLAALETIGKPVGFASAPEGALDALQDEENPGPDYLILYPLNSGRDGSLGDPWSDADFVYQVTVVARLPDGARALVGHLEAALASVVVAGRDVTQVVVEDDGPVRPDNDARPPVYIATPRYRLSTTPA